MVQSCVVSLEPVESTLKEAFEVEFWPPDQLPEGALGDLDPLEKTEIEPLQNTRVPAGRIIYEHIAAGLDPYPRAKDASFAWSEPEAAASETAGKGPFDVLKQLKPKT